jgi:hypothetical protein
MQIDPRYIENGIVNIVDNWAVLTKLGQAYGFVLLVNLTIVQSNTPTAFEVYQSVEVCDIPKHILRETPNSFRFTEKGIKWICGYISNYPFNLHLYNDAKELQEQLNKMM